MKALIVTPEGDRRVEDINRSLEALQGLVGGYIEAAPTDGSATVYVNEEGKLDGLPYNEVGTALYYRLAPFMEGQDFLVGTIVIVGPVDDEGYDTDLPDEVLEVLS